MAFYIRQAGDARTPVDHSRQLFKEHLKLFSLKGLSGKQGSGAPIIMDTTLKNEAGETRRHKFIPHAYAKPIRGQNAGILGNESAIQSFYMDVTVNEVNFPFRKEGIMTDQRTVFNVRKEMSAQIRDHFAQYNEDQPFKVMSGIGFEDDDQDGWELATNTTERVSGSKRIIRAVGAAGWEIITPTTSTTYSSNAELLAGTGCAAGALAVDDTLSCELIERASIMVRTADARSNDSASSRTNTYKMRPVRIKQGGNNLNQEFFYLFVSLEAAADLRFSETWVDHAESLADRGIAHSPQTMGAVGIWNNVIIVPSERIVRFRSAAGLWFARNLLIGADALFCGWAKTTDYTEELVDHQKNLSVNGCEIRGEKKVEFNGVDMGVAQVITKG